MVVSELYKIAYVHLYSQGFTHEEMVEFELALKTSSNAAKLEELEVWSKKLEIAKAMKEDKLASMEYIYEHVLDLTAEEFKTEVKRMILLR